MPKTITTNSAGLTLSNPAYNPLYINPGITVATASGPAISSGLYWTIDNMGVVTSTGAGSNAGAGVALSAGGVLTNTSTGTISGYGFGVSIAGTGTVVNQGRVTATQTNPPGFVYTTVGSNKYIGSVLNAGLFLGQGSIVNGTSAVISGAYVGLYVNGAGGVNNAGAIRGTSTKGFGAFLHGGTVSNAANGVISGGRFGIVNVSGSLSAANYGSISGTASAGVDLLAGGTVANQSGGSIYGGAQAVVIAGSAGNVVNQGSLGGNEGVYLRAGGTIANATGGTINGHFAGVIAAGGTVSLTNQSLIQNTTTHTTQTYALGGILLFGGGSVSNSDTGTIAGTSYGLYATGVSATVTNLGSITAAGKAGIDLASGGSVANLTSGAIAGYISGGYYGVVANGAATVTNQGTIRARTAFANQTFAFGGVILGAGGSVNNSGTILSGSNGVRVAGAAGTVVNSGTINSTKSYGGGGAINLRGGGSITNSGGITSKYFGVYVVGGSGLVSNSGTITSTRTQAAAGVAVVAGGTVTNGIGGVITSPFIGVQFGGFPNKGTGAAPAASLYNQGTIFASDGTGHVGAAVWINAPGVVTNAAGASIEGGPLGATANGPFGIVSYYQTTVINRGTIGGITAFAASNAALAETNLIEMAPGASFGGLVVATNSVASSSALATLELLSGASMGTISGFGSKYLGFSNIALDNGARWSLDGSIAAGTTIAFTPAGTGSLTLGDPSLENGTIANFSGGDTLSLAGITSTTGVSPLPMTSADQLTINGTGLVLQFDGSATGKTFFATVAGGQTNITVSCFAAGTSIRTQNGPVRVEALAPGQCALTHRGDAVEIIWVGHRSVDCRNHPDPAAVCPVRVRTGAFGPGLPSIDLLLSPDHAVFAEGVLIPIRHLINNTTIYQEIVPAVTYYHVELPEHDVILAEGLPVESYLDTGDRTNFSNGGGAMRLFPDFSARPEGKAWEMSGCAPLVMTGPVLERVRRAVARRAVPTVRLNNRYTYY